MNLNFRQTIRLITFVFLTMSLNSCILSKKIKYIQTENGALSEGSYNRKQVAYHVQPGDNIYIKFSSIEPVSNEVLSGGVNTMVSQSFGAKYKDVYLVDSAGYISVPQLNKVLVKNLSLTQIRDSVENKIRRYFQQATAEVRLADNYITILGEVNSPNRYLIDFEDKISILELIGMAGDLSFEANRKEVKLIRTKDNKTEVFSIDLTKRNLLENDHYYLMPNDIVYVEPLKAMSWHAKSFPFATSLALILSTTSAILVIITYIK
ncbi:MAG: polysaccharide biosynthesis/export family protein [Bacteroidales bacterium]|nr:polysaccharide biosynthesis/export family protein [Bacteroidales bacterium]